MQQENEVDRISRYAAEYVDSYGYEATLVRARRRLVVSVLRRWQPRSVVEVGCGSELQFDHAASALDQLARWIVVEPVEAFCRPVHERMKTDRRLVLVNDFIERAAAPIASMGPPQADVVLLSGLLHEVPDPAALLRTAKKLLPPTGGLLHVNVPNALSLHRRLARAAGLIPDEHDLSVRNKALLQPRVFDLRTLQTLLRSVGFEPTETGGCGLKPFTNDQMAMITPHLPAELEQGLWKLGRELPDLASEIYVNCTT